VLDKDRRPVRGLTAADFTILENGKPRPIVAFSAVELPSLPTLPSSAAAGADTVMPDVTRNDALQEVVAAQNVVGAEQFAGAGAADARYTLPLNQLKPGAYVLRIDAAAERTTGRRDVRFTVQ